MNGKDIFSFLNTKCFVKLGILSIIATPYS